MDSLAETIKTFDKYAGEYQGKYMNYVPYVETYAALSKLLAADAKVLDLACGPGNITQFLLNDKPTRKIHGIDLSEKMVSLAKENNPAATFAVMDCRKFAALGEKYDGIVAGFFVPYLSLPEVEEFISDAKASLQPGGILYLSFMEGDYESSGLQTKNGIDWVCTYYYDAQDMVNKLVLAGFDITETTRKSFERDGEPEAMDIFIYAKAR